MIKHYKNIAGAKIDVTMFGVGRIEVPADAACVPLESGVVDVLNKMSFPSVILEEVEVTYTAVDNPIVTSDTLDDIEEINPVDIYTKAELVAMCEEKGISHTAKDTKTDLYARLF